MKISSKGQITIPKEIRERTGMLPDTEVDFVVKGNVVHIVKSSKPSQRGEHAVSAIRGRATSLLTTDEIMKLTRG